MIITRPEDIIHKVQLLRLLTEIADNPVVSSSVYFKGGTCASMLGLLNRFSVDLDFDLKPKTSITLLKKELLKIFEGLYLEIKNQSRNILSFILKYQTNSGQRNNLKFNILPISAKSNVYQPQFLAEIDRILICQTIETMFANKLVAPLDRFKKYRSIAGRDFYDIHHFFLQGYRYEPKIITERTKLSLPLFFQKLIDFTAKKLNNTLIDQDLNMLLTYEAFGKIRKNLKTEVLMMLKNEVENSGRIQ